ncbi:nuclear transport factor 2 family protein [Fibrella forsythiae]|uniref:Nuclear transport factor 2 family protein n=1 Tax=Fibrella forsythiae TaxID=2817061 RepID=A0ABS3JJD6_9BACT|nr:nuclear transport factor 2 family protein [Fibrella forsythiae]MBO0950105.1 nuclear transport factor 2 family protein [Fibrella forsythiae]
MKTLLLLLFLPLASFAQTMETTPQEDVAIMQAVDDLFEGMKKADSSAVKAAFASGATLQTVTNTAGFVSVRTESISDFASQVGKAKPGDLNEIIQPYQIQIDGDLATAFIPYSFNYKGKTVHCGANAFTLVRFNGVWKIQAIIDTRRKCL